MFFKSAENRKTSAFPPGLYLLEAGTPTGSKIFKIIIYIMLYSSPVLLYHLIYLLKEKPVYNKFRRFEFLLYVMMIFLIIVNSGSSGAFIYFQF